jgi:hypothetical protein
LAPLVAGALHRLRELVTSRGRRLSPEALQTLSGDLADQKRRLDEFTAAMEREFVDLGALLRKISVLSRDVRERSEKIMDAASGRSEDAAIQFAFQLLKKAEDLVQAGRDQYSAALQLFGRMRSDLTRVARERDSLVRTLAPLESTNTQFRIQACFLDEATRAQFFNLADSIAAIVKDVRSAVEQRFEELERAGRATGEMAGKLGAMAAEQRLETERMLADTRLHLSTLNDALLESGKAAQTISAAGANIGQGVVKAIVALQCQDMARQKFQHIGAAIDEMVAHIEPGLTTGFGRAAEADCRHFLAEAGRVQLEQLRAVFTQLEDAGESAGGGLLEVESEARSLTGRALSSGGAALNGHVIKQAVDSIEAVLGVIENAVAGVRKVAELIVRLKATFSDCTSQILGLARHLRIVSLNAQIFAAHVETGAALEVVAGNTRTIVDESMQELDEISHRVSELMDSVTELEQRLADFAELAAIEQRVLAREARESEARLGTLERDLRAAMSAIGPVEEHLGASIAGAVGSIRFRQAVAEARARSLSLFERVVERYAEPDAGAHEKVQTLKRNYTMAHERDVHESAVGAGDPRVAEPPEEELAICEIPEEADPSSQESSETQEERLAENVELF